MEGKLWDSIFSFYHVGLRDYLRSSGLMGDLTYHLAGPIFIFINLKSVGAREIAS